MSDLVAEETRMEATPSSTKALFLLVPGFDWRLAQPLVDSGKMPNLDALIEGGTIGNLATAPPLRWPAPLVSSITGTLGDCHGVFSPFEATKDGEGNHRVRLFHLARSPQAMVWDVLAQQGLRAAHVGFPGTYPVHPGGSVTAVSDMFAHAKGKTFEDWPFDEASVSPDLPKTVFETLRLHPREVTPEMLLPFLEAPQTLDLETDTRAAMIVALLARLSSLHGAATWILEERQPDVLAVHLDFLQHLSSLFIGYAAPKMDQVTQVDHALYGKVVEGAYRFFDMLLGRYRQLLGDHAHILISSLHGMRLGDMRSPPRPDGKINAVDGYRPLGTLLAHGPRVVPDGMVTGVRVEDLAPTFLTLLGASVPGSMTGKVRDGLFAEDIAVTPTTVEARSDLAPATMPASVAEYLTREWVSLGLARELPTDAEFACEAVDVERCLAEASLYMIRMTPEASDKATAALERVLDYIPDHPDALVRLCQLALRRQDVEACEGYLLDLDESGVTGVMATLLKAQNAVLKKDTDAARDALTLAETLAVKMPKPIRIYEQIGQAWLQLNAPEEAARVFGAAHVIDPDDPLINTGLGHAHTMQKDDGAAIEAYQASLAVLHEQPKVYYSLGQAQARLGQTDQALKSFATTLQLAPNFDRARRSLNTLTREIAQKTAAPGKALHGEET